MNITTITLLLQMISSLLSGAQHNPEMSATTAAQLVALSSRTLQIATQAVAHVDFPVPANDSIWPTAGDLLAAPYLDASGKYVRQGGFVKLAQDSLSFGDLNGDGLDDGAAIVTRPSANGGTESVLAAFLNQNSIMFNIADFSLGAMPVTVYSHNIAFGGLLVMDMQASGLARATTTYRLIGSQILEVK